MVHLILINGNVPMEHLLICRELKLRIHYPLGILDLVPKGMDLDLGGDPTPTGVEPATIAKVLKCSRTNKKEEEERNKSS